MRPVSEIFGENCVLRSFCTDNLYRDNPFFLLRTPTNATQKRLRRRKENLDAASANGAEYWQREFTHLPTGINAPSQDQVKQLFGKLENPEYRLVSEFFWFWPISDKFLVFSSEHLLDAAFADMLRECIATASSDVERISARHNLAILYHFLAIEKDLSILGMCGRSSSLAADDANASWQNAIDLLVRALWDNDMWAYFGRRIAEFGDPRIPTTFLRNFRDAAPLILANVNAHLALSFAKNQDAESVHRHKKYMRWIVNESNEVDNILCELLSPLERELSLLIRRYDSEVQSLPEDALTAANALLTNGKNIIRLADMVSHVGNPLRQDLAESIVKACNCYQTAYGSKTGDWKKCIPLLRALQEIGLPKNLLGLINDNLAIAERNYEAVKLVRYCWFCQENLASDDSSIEVPLYGELQCQITDKENGKYSVTWSKHKIRIPRCKYCESLTKQREQDLEKAYFMLDKAISARPFWKRILSIKTAAMENEEMKVREVQDRNIKIARLEEKRKMEYPLLKEFLGRDFRVGDKPSQSECSALYYAERDFLNRYSVRGDGFVMV